MQYKRETERERQKIRTLNKSDFFKLSFELIVEVKLKPVS